MKNSMRSIVFMAVFCALIAVGAQIAVPVVPVPIILGNLFVVLAGIILGGVNGLLAVMLYLLLGLAGLPVFSHFGAGPAHFAGPGGGYLIGYMPAAFLAGLVCARKRYSLPIVILASLAGFTSIFAVGIPWLKIVKGYTWGESFLYGLVPYVPGEAIKTAAAVGIVKGLRLYLGERSADGVD